MRLLRVALRLADDVAGRAIDRAAGAILERLDGYAFAYFMMREGLHRDLAAELLERLGADLGAKIEMPATFR